MHLCPLCRHPRQGEDGRDMLALGHAHGAASFGDRDVHSAASENAKEYGSWGAATVVNGGAGPVEEDGTEGHGV